MPLPAHLLSPRPPRNQPGASGPRVGRTGGRKLRIGWEKKGWGLRWAPGPNLAPPPGPAEVSFRRRRGTQAGFQDERLASSALDIIARHCGLSRPSRGPSLPGRDGSSRHQPVLPWPLWGGGAILPWPLPSAHLPQASPHPSVPLRNRLAKSALAATGEEGLGRLGLPPSCRRTLHRHHLPHGHA